MQVCAHVNIGVSWVQKRASDLRELELGRCDGLWSVGPGAPTPGPLQEQYALAANLSESSLQPLKQCLSLKPSHYVDPAGLKAHSLPLHLPHECWDERCVPPRLAPPDSWQPWTGTWISPSMLDLFQVSPRDLHLLCFPRAGIPHATLPLFLHGYWRTNSDL